MPWESLTNPRLRDEVGDIRLMPPEDRVYGDGASWIMAAFTTRRWMDEVVASIGISVSIIAPRMRRSPSPNLLPSGTILRESRIDKTTQEMRVIRAQLGPTSLHDVRHLAGNTPTTPMITGTRSSSALRYGEANSFGIHYQSVRVEGYVLWGDDAAQVLSDAIHWRYLRYHYERVNR